MKITKITLVVLIFVLLGMIAGTTYAAAPVCTKLSADLSYRNENSRVTALQNFLVATGYMTVKPNGYFGPATRAAVKAFQKAQKISTTGTAGPLTRAAIQKISCIVPNQNKVSISTGTPISLPVVTTVSTSISTSTTTATSSVSIIPSSVIRVVAPAAGETLRVGTNHTIFWDSVFSNMYNIILENEHGTSIGFIAANRSGGTSYTWKVGQVYTYLENGQQSVDVASGTYRIRLKSYYGSYTEKVSAAFAIADYPLTINSVVPNSVPNDNNSVGVLYGSGFKTSSRINFYNSYTSIPATISYVSQNGTVLVFSVPQSVPPGQYSAYMTNNASSTTQFNLTVTTASAQ